jgi:hypothetical protein
VIDDAFDGDGAPAGAEGLKSVNWLTGMLLTPQHFERQDRFVEESARWVVRHALPHAGLVGGGLRADPRATNLAQFDPQLEVEDDGETVRLALLFARGVTPAGDVVDVAEPDIVRVDVPRAALAGVTETLVSVERAPTREEDPGSVGRDPANPHQAALRRPRHRLLLGGTPDQRPHALVVGRVRRVSETLGFDRDGSYIPPCAAVLAHSALYAGWVQLRDEVVHLAGRYGELHKAVAAYAEQLAVRGVDVRGDLDSLAFVERAVLALDDCAYGLTDPARPPVHVFEQIERLGRRVALALDLSAATRLFLHAISGVDAGYEVLLDEERQALARRRGWHPREDLARSLEAARDTVRRVRDLCEAIEGKYLDYRVNRTVDALRFLLERAGEGFYTAVATPGHPRREGDLLTFDFSPLALPGRQEYRVLLVGDAGGVSPWQVGESFAVDVWVNPGAGGARPLSRTVRCEVPGQRNFAVTFDAPGDVGTLAALRVTVHEHGSRLRRAALYQRGRGVVADVPVVAVSSAAPSAAPAYVPAPAAARGGPAVGPFDGQSERAPAGPDADANGPAAPPAASPAPGSPVTGSPTAVPRLRTIPLRKPTP